MNQVLGEARFYFAQCVFNASCHYAAYDRYERRRAKSHYITIGISGVVIVVLILTIIFWQYDCKRGLEILAFLGLVCTAISLVFELYNKEDITEIMCGHKQAAEDYKRLRDSFMDIIRLMKSNVYNIGESHLQQCLHDYGILGKYSLCTNEQDYVNAQQKLGLNGKGEAFTWSSNEIDRFLPHELREGGAQVSV